LTTSVLLPEAENAAFFERYKSCEAGICAYDWKCDLSKEERQYLGSLKRGDLLMLPYRNTSARTYVEGIVPGDGLAFKMFRQKTEEREGTFRNNVLSMRNTLAQSRTSPNKYAFHVGDFTTWTTFFITLQPHFEVSWIESDVRDPYAPQEVESDPNEPPSIQKPPRYQSRKVTCRAVEFHPGIRNVDYSLPLPVPPMRRDLPLPFR